MRKKTGTAEAVAAEEGEQALRELITQAGETDAIWKRELRIREMMAEVGIQPKYATKVYELADEELTACSCCCENYWVEGRGKVKLLELLDPSFVGTVARLDRAFARAPMSLEVAAIELLEGAQVH